MSLAQTPGQLVITDGAAGGGGVGSGVVVVVVVVRHPSGGVGPQYLKAQSGL